MIPDAQHFLTKTTCDIVGVTRCVRHERQRPCATACSCSKDSYRSRDTRGRKERAWTTHSPRAVITLAGCALRAPQQRRWSWLIIIAIRSLPFAIRRVRVPNIVPYKASWSSRAIRTSAVRAAFTTSPIFRLAESRVSNRDCNTVKFYAWQKEFKHYASICKTDIRLMKNFKWLLQKLLTNKIV